MTKKAQISNFLRIYNKELKNNYDYFVLSRKDSQWENLRNFSIETHIDNNGLYTNLHFTFNVDWEIDDSLEKRIANLITTRKSDFYSIVKFFNSLVDKEGAVVWVEDIEIFTRSFYPQDLLSEQTE